MNWRFIDLDLADAHRAPAIFEAVMEARGKDLVGDTILFWRPSRPAVYIGFHQLALEDIEVEACARDGVPVIRRILGGGTGYCDPGQLIYNVIYSEDNTIIPRGPRNVYKFLLRGVLEALSILGLGDAEIEEERYGVYLKGRKISGSGQLTSNGVVNSSGSFLVDFDYDSMKKYLKDPVKNLRQGVLRPEDGMICLSEEICDIGIDQAGAALRKGFEKILGKSLDSCLTTPELERADQLLAKYKSDEWTYRADNRLKMRKRAKNKI